MIPTTWPSIAIPLTKEWFFMDLLNRKSGIDKPIEDVIHVVAKFDAAIPASLDFLAVGGVDRISLVFPFHKSSSRIRILSPINPMQPKDSCNFCINLSNGGNIGH